MADDNTAREAWITGIGIVSCLGEGPDDLAPFVPEAFVDAIVG